MSWENWRQWLCPGVLGALSCLSGCATTTSSSAQRQSQLSNEIAEVLVAHHANEQATPLLQRAVAEDPTNARVHTMLGIVLRDRGLFEQAEAELLLANKLQADDTDTLSALGVTYDKWGKGDLAESWHRRALALRPQSPDLLNNLGFSLFLRQHTEQSIEAYKEALRHDPSARRVYNNLGFAHARQRDFAQAYKDFENAGGKAAAMANLALAYELSGDLESAKTFYNEALKLDKGLTMARHNVAALAARQVAEGAAQEKQVPD
jgi:Flp pilus assembly protein TadD